MILRVARQYQARAALRWQQGHNRINDLVGHFIAAASGFPKMTSPKKKSNYHPDAAGVALATDLGEVPALTSLDPRILSLGVYKALGLRVLDSALEEKLVQEIFGYGERGIIFVMFRSHELGLIRIYVYCPLCHTPVPFGRFEQHIKKRGHPVIRGEKGEFTTDLVALPYAPPAVLVEADRMLMTPIRLVKALRYNEPCSECQRALLHDLCVPLDPWNLDYSGRLAHPHCVGLDQPLRYPDVR